MPPEGCKVAWMEDLLLDLVHRKWRALAVLACVAWIIDGYFEGNTVFEALAGLLFICMWTAAIYLLDRWALRATKTAAPLPAP
jgi:hypothetical protein